MKGLEERESMKRLIFNVISTKEGHNTSPNVHLKTERVVDMYIKNSFVSLTSAKHHNPDDDVCLIVNFDLSESTKQQFEKAQIKTYKIEFNCFVMPKEYRWSLAFFKLCGLKWALKNLNYDQYLLLDSDTYTVNKYTDIWTEANDSLLLFNTLRKFSYWLQTETRNIYKDLYGRTANIIHMGGEFICGKKNDLQILIDDAENVYDKMRSIDFELSSKGIGDEAILSISVHNLKNKLNINMANAYIYRFTTSFKVYEIDTHFTWCIWHVPTEKQHGMQKMYNYIQKYATMPTESKSMKMLSLRRVGRPNKLAYTMNRLISYIDAKLQIKTIFKSFFKPGFTTLDLPESSIYGNTILDSHIGKNGVVTHNANTKR